MKTSDRYLKLVEWSEEDGCYVGTAPGLMLGGVHGDDEADVYRRLCETVEDVIASYDDPRQLPPATASKTYSGKFQLRLGAALHKSLAIRAQLAGDSLNSFCVKLLRRAVNG